MAESGELPGYDVMARLLREFGSTAGGDSALERAVTAAGEALNVWRDRIEQLAAHDRARADVMLLEQRARDQVSLILDLVQRLAAVPESPAMPSEESRCRPPPSTSERRDVGLSGETGPPREGLAILLLGAFELHVGGKRVTAWRGRRGPTVLQYLVSRGGAAVEREVLTEALWPDISPDLGRHRVHQAVYALRQTLDQIDPGPQHILCTDGAYRLNPDLSWWTDVAEFERLVTLGGKCDAEDRQDDALAAYRSADALYRGDFVEGAVFADWAAAERRRLRALYVLVGNRLGEIHVERGDHAAALKVCGKVLERDAWNEEVTRRAMASYAASGNPSLALQMFRSFEAELAKELGVAPSTKTRELFAQLCGRVSPDSSPQPSIR